MLTTTLLPLIFITSFICLKFVFIFPHLLQCQILLNPIPASLQVPFCPWTCLCPLPPPPAMASVTLVMPYNNSYLHCSSPVPDMCTERFLHASDSRSRGSYWRGVNLYLQALWTRPLLALSPGSSPLLRRPPANGTRVRIMFCFWWRDYIYFDRLFTWPKSGMFRDKLWYFLSLVVLLEWNFHPPHGPAGM